MTTTSSVYQRGLDGPVAGPNRRGHKRVAVIGAGACGICAAKYLLSGGRAVMVSMQGGEFVPIPFRDLLDAATGRTRVRYVNVHSTRYAIARRYMIRLRRDDFANPHEIARFAAVAHLSLEEFREQFEFLVRDEPPPLDLAAPVGVPPSEGVAGTALRG